ncbi:MAG: hypothetical protein KC449_24945, partial [Anaerolineales bacterium]|nr:hypothetical protein [Anaerolineales bacterium]
MPIMSCQNRNALLHKNRIFFSIVLLGIVLYFILYTWVTLPPLTLFLGWQPETKFTVLPLVEDEYSQYVQPGDVVLAINGRSTQRGRAIFTPPVKSSYDLTLQRGPEIFSREIPVASNYLFKVWQVSIGTLALAIWFIGFMTVKFAQPEQASPMYVGFGFQLIGTGIVSPGPSQLGAPGAWVIGQVLIFYFPLIILYLGFMPRFEPLPASIKRLLRGTFYLLTALALLAATEALFLFPEHSFADLAAISLGTILTILAGISIVGALAILLNRLIQAPKQSYVRQQLAILFAFLILALTPLFVFVVLPLGEIIFVPYPFVYSLLLLAPAGYFFVLHRQGHLALDPLFSRIVTILVLILAVSMAYATGIFLLYAVFKVDFDTTGQGAFLVVLFGIAITGQKRVQAYVDLLLYGRDTLNQDAIQIAKAKISASPEPATVADVTQQLADYLNVQNVAVLIKDSEQYTLLVGTVPHCVILYNARVEEVFLRAQNSDHVVGFPEWVDLSIPIKARGDMIGLLVLSRPVGGYFNAHQVEVLQDVVDILAFGLLVIGLVGTMQELSQQALHEKEMQRQQIATEIHNEPLHVLTTLMMQLQAQTADETMQNAAQTIRQVTRDLRRIISDLRPPVLKESIEWITRQVVREFDETHDGIDVVLSIKNHKVGQASEKVKSAFYYILTESLNNISKHARANNVEVYLYYSDEMLLLEVNDDGVG